MHGLTGQAAARSSGMLVVMLIAMTAFSQFFRTSVGTIAPELRGDIGLDARLLGLANGSFFVAFLVLQLPLGLLFDRYGVRRCVVALTGLAALGSLWGAYAFEPWSFIASRVLVGVGSAGYFMGALVIAGAWFRERRFVSVLSWVYALSNLGTLAATAPLSAAAQWVGWRAAFVGIAVLTAALGLGLHLYVRDAPPDAPPVPTPPASLAAMLDGWREVWRTPGLQPILAMAAIAYASVSTILGTWAAPYLNDVFGAGPYLRGELLLLFAAAQVLGTLGWGQLAAHRLGTTWVIVLLQRRGLSALGLLALWPGAAARLADGAARGLLPARGVRLAGDDGRAALVPGAYLRARHHHAQPRPGRRRGAAADRDRHHHWLGYRQQREPARRPAIAWRSA